MNDDSRQGGFEAYSDYQHISREIAHDILDAGRAATAIQRYHTERGEYQPREIAEASASLLTPAYMLVEQMEMHRGGNDTLDEILADWNGEDGYLAQIQNTDFLREYPGFMDDFVRQLHRAGLELGYLQAGRETKNVEIDDERDAAVSDMF
jgi:hypothetical protein